MMLAMSNIAWAPEERFQAYEAMAEAGFAGLEIAPGLFFHASDDPFVPSEAEAAEALSEIADHGLQFVSMQSLLFGVQGAGLFDGEEARAALVKGMHRAIDLAGRFGIPNLVFGSPAQRKVPEDMALDRALDEAAEVFRALGDRAQSVGTCITVEANPASLRHKLPQHSRTGPRLRRSRLIIPAIATILDLGAMHMNDSFDAVPEHIQTLTPRLNHVHVSEPELAPAPAQPERLTPVLEALAAQGYSKAVSIEMRRPDNGIDGVRGSIAALAQAAEAAGINGEVAHA